MATYHEQIFTGSDAPKSDIPSIKIIDKLDSVLGGRPALGKEMGKRTLQMESITTADVATLRTTAQTLTQAINSVMPETTRAQRTAANYALMFANAPVDYLRAAVRQETDIRSALGEKVGTMVAGIDGSIGDAMTSRPTYWSMEAFQESENQRVQQFSATYNLLSARQDEFGETLYPTVVIPPENYGYMVSINLAYVQDDIRRNITGALDNFNRRNLAHALIDSTILQDEQTRAYPVYRATGAYANTEYFLDAIGTTTVQVGTESVLTKPLLCGKEVNLIGISQTDGLIQGGVFDISDTLDSSVLLTKVYVKISVGNTTEYFAFPTDKLPGAYFNGAVQGNYQKMTLAFETAALKFTSTTKTTAGATSTLLAPLTDRVVRGKTDVYGRMILGDGNCLVTGTSVSISKITDANRQQVSDPAISAVFNNATVVGYELQVYRTNSNRRQRGQIIDNQIVNMLYTIPLRTPVSSLRPIGSTDADDAAKVSNLINATHVKTSNAAVGALLNLEETLQSFANETDAIGQSPLILGASSYLIRPTYVPMGDYNVATHLDSLKTSDRVGDLQTLLINKIRDTASRMAVDSGYLAALKVTYNGAPPKITVIIATDPIIERYLQLTGDTRIAGDQFDYKIISTLDSRMTGRMYVCFGLQEAMSSGTPNWLHHGNMAWRPELALVMPMVRNGANVTELTVQPAFRHINNLPIMGSCRITGIESIVAGKVAVNTFATA